MFGNGSSPRRDHSKDPRSADSRRSSGDSPRKESPNSKFPSLEDSPHLTPSQRFAGTSTFALPSPPLPSLPSNRSINSIDKQLSSANQQRLSQPAVPRSSSHSSFASPISPALPLPPRSTDGPAGNSPGKVVVLNSDRARRGISSEVGRSPSFSVGDIVVQAKNGEVRHRADRSVLKSTRRPSPAPPTDDETSTNRTPTSIAPSMVQGRHRDAADLPIDPNNNASRYPTAGGQPSTPPPAIPRRRIHQDDLQSSSGNLSYPQQQLQQIRQKSNSFSSPMQRPIPDSPAFYGTGKEISVDHLAEIAVGNLNGVGFSGGMGQGQEEVDWRSVLVGYQHQRANASSAPPLLSSPLSKLSYSGNARDASLSMGNHSMLPQSIAGDVGGGRRSEDAEIGFGNESARSARHGASGARLDDPPVRRGGSPERSSQRDSQMLSSPLAIHARAALPQNLVPSHPLPTPPTPSPEPRLPTPAPPAVVFSPAMLLVEESRKNGLLPTPPNSDLSHSPDLSTTVDAGRSAFEPHLRSPLALKPGPLPSTAKHADKTTVEPSPSMTHRMSLEDVRPELTNEKTSQPRLSIDTTFQQPPSTLPPQSIPPPITVEERQTETTTRPSRAAPPPRIAPIIPRIETPIAKIVFALSVHPDTILVSLLRHINLQTVQSLRKVSKTLARCLEVDAKEFVLQRFLGPYGYRSYATGDVAYSPATLRRREASSSSAEAREVVITSRLKQELVVLDLRDLDAFFIGIRYSIEEFYRFAQAHSNPNSPPLPVNTLCMIRASTRAWNRVVLRIRAQDIGGDDGEVLARLRMSYAFEGTRLEKGQIPIYKVGRAPVLRVWVPTEGGGTWLSDEELVECEREVWRSGVWNRLNRGDVVWNIALGDFANNGRTIFDGKFLRDVEYAYDFVGHLPSWLDMLSFSPSTYHNMITSSGNPVFYLSLSTFISQIRETLTLCQDKIAIASPQGEYIVKRFVYRSSIKLRSGTICGSEGGKGFGPGGVEVVHDDWVGFLILETDGTTEHATSLIARCSNPQPTPYRILREKSRAGKIWLTPVAESERIN